jgi:phage baseplate assembly protein W
MRKREEVKYNPIDFEVDRAIGLTLPLTNDSSIAKKFYASATGLAGNVEDSSSTHGGGKAQGGFHQSYTTKEQAASNLRNLVLTTQGERYMHPNFGCNVWSTLFENATPELIGRLKIRIQDQVKLWLPYLNLMDVYIAEMENNTLTISIDFALYNNTMDRETIVINVRNL